MYKVLRYGNSTKGIGRSQKIHNTHSIRPFPNQECPNGKTEIIYGLPEIYGICGILLFLKSQKTSGRIYIDEYKRFWNS